MLMDRSQVISVNWEVSDGDRSIAEDRPRDWYCGQCPRSGRSLRLPRTAHAESIARELMDHLDADCEGKMYGILIVETPEGDRGVLKAFSGLLNGSAQVPGWVPPIPGQATIAKAESDTLRQLESLKQALITLQQLPERQHYQALKADFDRQWMALCDRHRQRKLDRQAQRQAIDLRSHCRERSAELLRALETESQHDGIERRNFKRDRAAVLDPLQATIAAADAQLQTLKQQRKTISRSLQAQLFETYSITNFAGESQSIQQILRRAFAPTGTGDCCAPKLLHYAATHQLKPLAMAEFWWGAPSPSGDRLPGEFYGACRDRCQPLMGYLLSGLHEGEPDELPILFEDEWLIAVEKPSGVLSVPGRYGQPHVIARLQQQRSDLTWLQAVHRLDQDTSGVLLLARTEAVYRQLSLQFQGRQVGKCYEALLDGELHPPHDRTIELPLWSDPQQRPLQCVDWHRGKPSTTQVRVLSAALPSTRVELIPVTGRTHQLRVHAAHPDGLGLPILGDRWYGPSEAAIDRLHLHARDLTIEHPILKTVLTLHAPTPF